jgi:pyrroloquinoline quinone biosynthesis protein D
LIVSGKSVPALRRGVRRQFDASRNAAVLMAPERVVVLDEIADSILAECEEGSSIGDISERLSNRFQTPRETVEPDVIDFFQDLFDKGLVTL